MIKQLAAAAALSAAFFGLTAAAPAHAAVDRYYENPGALAVPGAKDITAYVKWHEWTNSAGQLGYNPVSVRLVNRSGVGINCLDDVSRSSVAMYSFGGKNKWDAGPGLTDGKENYPLGSGMNTLDRYDPKVRVQLFFNNLSDCPAVSSSIVYIGN